MDRSKTILSVALAAAGALPAAAQASGPQRPNIVFILIDDMGSGDIGCYGSGFYETPNIDAWAARSVRFTQAYASCHVSSPARASLLTGLYPATVGVTDWLPGRREYPFQQSSTTRVAQDLPHGIPNLAQTFHDAGYATALIGKWHLGETGQRPTQYGFDIHIPEGYLRGWPDTYYYPFGMNGYNGEPGDYLTDKMTDEAVSYIESQAGSGKPFFLLLSHFATHDPIQGRPDLVRKYTEKLASMAPADRPAYILEGNPDDPDALSPEEIRSLMDDPAYAGHKIFPHSLVKIKQIQDNVNFAAMVESVDESVGRVRKAISDAGIEDRTIVVFFADNGGMSAANYGNPNKTFTDPDQAYSSSMLPFRGGKGWMYEGGLRVPLIIDWPGHGIHGVTCDTPVTTPDLYNTLVSLTGVQAPSGAGRDGVDITPLLEGRSIRNRALYWHFPHYSNHGMQSPCGAVRFGDWKLIEYYDHGTRQLFNIADDVSETTDLAARYPGKVRRLARMLARWRKNVGAQMPSPNLSFDGAVASSWKNNAAPVKYWPCRVADESYGTQGYELAFMDGFSPKDAVEKELARGIDAVLAFKKGGQEGSRLEAEAVFKEWNSRRGTLNDGRQALLWDILCASLYDVSGHGRFLVFVPVKDSGSELYPYWEAIALNHVAGELNNNLEIIGTRTAQITPGIKFGGGIIDVSRSTVPEGTSLKAVLRDYTAPYIYKGYSIEMYVGFAAREVTVLVNGVRQPSSTVGNRGFVSIKREWVQGDTVEAIFK